MMRKRQVMIWIAALSVCLVASTAFGQLSISRGQRPGQMVNSGVFQSQSFGAPVQITTTSQPSSIRSTFFAQAVGIIFTQINQAVDAFAALLVLRAGGTPALPALPSTTTTTPSTPSTNTNTQPRRKAASVIKSYRHSR